MMVGAEEALEVVEVPAEVDPEEVVVVDPVEVVVAAAVVVDPEEEAVDLVVEAAAAEEAAVVVEEEEGAPGEALVEVVESTIMLPVDRLGLLAVQHKRV